MAVRWNRRYMSVIFSEGTIANLPGIIRAAAASPLGIAALALIILGRVAALFFKKSPDKRKYGVFLLLTGFALFAVVFTRTWNNAKIPAPTTQSSSGPQSPNINGTSGNVSVQYGAEPKDEKKDEKK